MKKKILKKAVSGFMILLMVVGIFVAVSNFTAKSINAMSYDGGKLKWCVDWCFDHAGFYINECLDDCVRRYGV